MLLACPRFQTEVQHRIQAANFDFAYIVERADTVPDWQAVAVEGVDTTPYWQVAAAERADTTPDWQVAAAERVDIILGWYTVGTEVKVCKLVDWMLVSAVSERQLALRII